MSSTPLRRHHRRPPKDPSAALRPQNALEQAAMLSFRQKVQQANANSICGTTSDHVGRLPMRKLLAMDQFCVPIFQRRYCWGETQWKTLLEDAAAAAVGKPHSLGRLTCTRTDNDSDKSSGSKILVSVEGRSCILDGQQRFTTTTILLAVIRDLLEELQGQCSAFAGTIQAIQQLLFLDTQKLEEWSKTPDCLLQQGEVVSFARLVPTFCDRWAYYTAILPDLKSTPTTATPLPRPLQAQQYFRQRLRAEYNSFPKLTGLLRGLLDGCTMLFFPVDVDTHQQDGTDDLMVIYERLALRDATFCKPTRKEEYQAMDGSDMIRNLLLGSFAGEVDAKQFYQDYWLPLEQQVASRTDGKSMALVFQSFLRTQKTERTKEEVGIIGGQLYAEFQAWFARRLTKPQNPEEESSIEARVRDVGSELVAFSHNLL